MISTDVLSSVLRLLRFKANVFFHSSFCGAWTVDTSGSGRSTFHLIADGSGWLHMDQLEQPVLLSKGDLVVFPRDAKHAISSSDITLSNKDENKIIDSCSTEEEAAALICGYFDFDNPQRNPIIHAMPEYVVVRSNDQDKTEPWLETLISMMRSETDQAFTGSDVVVDKLSEILFIYVVRSYIREENPEKGILAALSDMQISRALDALHDNPANVWTVERLAERAGMSRAAFARRFSGMMNQSPMHYVTQWRMQLARIELCESKKSVIEIAEAVGYSSEASFRKAFKQALGETPGSVRKSRTI